MVCCKYTVVLYVSRTHFKVAHLFIARPRPFHHSHTCMYNTHSTTWNATKYNKKRCFLSILAKYKGFSLSADRVDCLLCFSVVLLKACVVNFKIAPWYKASTATGRVKLGKSKILGLWWCCLVVREDHYLNVRIQSGQKEAVEEPLYLKISEYISHQLYRLVFFFIVDFLKNRLKLIPHGFNLNTLQTNSLRL